MKFRIKCPECRYAFVVSAQSTRDEGRATCPLWDCGATFRYRGPDAPGRSAAGAGEIFEELFGGSGVSFENIFKKRGE